MSRLMECPHEGRLSFCGLPMVALPHLYAWECPRGHRLDHVEWMYRGGGMAEAKWSANWQARQLSCLVDT